MNKKQLEEIFLRAKYEYYILSKPTMLDSDFDKLEKELRDMESEVVDLVDFPDQEYIKSMGYDLEKICPEQKVKRNEVKIKHWTPMLSIKKLQINDEKNIPYNELNLFLKKEKCDIYELSPKFDGNSMDICYIDGNIVSAISRGNGIEGVDKLHKMRLLVPNRINIKGKIEVRGEVLIPRKIYQEKYIVDGEVSNERSCVGGLLNKEDVNFEEIHDLVFVAYSLVSISNDKIEYIENTIQTLEELGFNKKHKPFIKYMKDSSEFEKLYFEFKEYRENCEFLLDGIVIKFKENLRSKMISKTKYPAWSLAIKFLANEASTIIENIIWTQSKEGYFCPIAILKEVELGGTMNRRASLHNLGFIIEHSAYPGCVVSIRKAGEIINQVVAVLEKSPNNAEYIKEFNDFMKDN